MSHLDGGPRAFQGKETGGQCAAEEKEEENPGRGIVVESSVFKRLLVSF